MVNEFKESLHPACVVQVFRLAKVVNAAVKIRKSLSIKLDVSQVLTRRVRINLPYKFKIACSVHHYTSDTLVGQN